MTFVLDLTDDYKIFDGLADVTCYPAESPEVGSRWTQGTAVSIADGRVEKIDAVEVEPSAGVYSRADTRIRLPAKLCSAMSYVPGIGDLIETADAALWTVLRVGAPRFNNSWSCFCRQLLMAGGLCDSVTLLSASVENVHGSKVTCLGTGATGIACRIQPLGEQEITLQARMGYDVNCVIYAAEDVEIKFDDLFLDEADGVTLYEIKYSAARRRIDVLSSYYCRRRP